MRKADEALAMLKKQTTSKKITILHVEDSETIGLMVHRMLTQFGYEVRKAATGADALSRAQEQPDMIILDINLPDISGFEVCKRLKADPTTAHIPILHLSATYLDDQSRVDGLEGGADGYLTHPVEPLVLTATIKALLRVREAEKESRKSEERLKDIIFSSADWVWEVDENGVYTYSSQRGFDLFGKSQGDIIGKTPFDFMPPDEAKRVAAIFSGIVANKAHIKDLDNWNIGRNGERFCLLTNGVPILDKEGNLKGYRGVDKDITEQKMAAEKLLRSENDLRVLIGKNVDGLIIVDSDGILRFMNPAAESLFGRKMENLIGTSMGLPLVSGEATEMEISGKDGVHRIVDMRATSINWEEREAFLVSLRDITERKNAEEDLRKSLLGAVQAIASIVELKDPYTAGHQRRVSSLAWTMAQEMGLASEQCEGIRIAGMIHDLGKVSVPTEILSKPGKISDLEFNLIKAHVQSGYDILKVIDFPWPLDQMILQHHEKMDGSGYPQGLPGRDILLEARIIAVADVVEAMATHRPYRPALGVDQALDEITKNRGVFYDPEAVDVCLRLFREKGFKFDT